MNVLIIFFHNNGLYPIKGNSTRVWNLIRSLTEHNINVSILHSIKAKGLEDRDLKNKCKIFYHRDINIFGLREKFFNDVNPFIVFKLLKILRKSKFDIIQLEYPFGFFVLKILSNKKTKIIYDSHNTEGDFVRTSLRNSRFPHFLKPLVPLIMYITKFYEKLVCSLSNLIISVSEIDRNYYLTRYKIKKSKIAVIQTPSSYNPIDIKNLKKLKLISRKKLGLPLDKTIIIFHGVLPHHPNKEAFNLIKNYIAPQIKDKNILFVIAGLNLKKFEKENIISLGYVRNLKDLLISADFAIIPIISGGGMRVKCSDYIISSLPFIITKKGAQGLEFLKEGEDFLQFDKVNHEFLEGIKILTKNIELRKTFSRNLGKKSKYVNHNYFGEKFIKLYSKLVKSSE